MKKKQNTSNRMRSIAQNYLCKLKHSNDKQHPVFYRKHPYLRTYIRVLEGWSRGKQRGTGGGGSERFGQSPSALAHLTLRCGGRSMHRGKFSSTQHLPTAASSTHGVMTTKMSPDTARCPHGDRITPGGEPLSRNKSLKNGYSSSR